MSFRTLQECIHANTGIEKNPKEYCKDHFPELKQKIYQQCPVLPMNTVREMIMASRACITKHPNLQNHKNACEVGLIPSENQDFSLHTHTHEENIDYPSPRDIETTTKWGKKFLCIAEATTGKLKCFSAEDRFSKPVCNRKVI